MSPKINTMRNERRRCESLLLRITKVIYAENHNIFAQYKTGIIYDYGTMNYELTTEGYNFGYDSTAYTNLGVSQWSPYIPLYLSGEYSSYHVGTVLGTAEKIDVTEYSSLQVTIDSTYSIDISSLQGEYYIWVARSRYYTYSGNADLNGSHLCFGLSTTKNCVGTRAAWWHRTEDTNGTIPRNVFKIELVK